VSLCAQLCTSYCDITGEVDWVRDMIDQFHTVAKKSGARIISLSGHDSVPWDLSTLELARALKIKGEELRSVQLFDEVKVVISGGTTETIFYSTAKPNKKRSPIDPMSLTDSGEKSPAKLTSILPFNVQWSPTIKKYTSWFIMSQVNFSAVKRTNSILQYSSNFTYQERVVVGSYCEGLMELLSLFGFMVSLYFFPTRWFLRKFTLPQVGKGPSKEEMDKGFLKVTGYGEGDKGGKVKSVLYFPTDPAYRDTARMLVETGLTLAFNSAQLEIGGGVYTPGCLGNPLLQRLIDTGCYWKIE